MTVPIAPAGTGSSTRPYLIRALHDWCTDNGFTPYIAVHVDGLVRVPMEYVKNNEIVLNIGFEATTGLQLGNDAIEFKARFGGTSRDLYVPIGHVIAIYARENGQGMAFPAPEPMPAIEPGVIATGGGVTGGLRLATDDNGGDTSPQAKSGSDSEGDRPPPDAPSPNGRPALKRVK